MPRCPKDSLQPIICRVVLLLCICSLLFWPRLVAAQPAANPLVVTAVRISRPVALGRFATGEATIKNTGDKAIDLKAAGLFVVMPDGKEEAFEVSAFNPPLAGGLQAGQEYTFRQFKRMLAPGDYSCFVKAQDEQGHWLFLNFAAGGTARAALQVVPGAAMPQAKFKVVDPNLSHVYQPGDMIRLVVVPILTGGADLTAQVSTLKVATDAKPFAMTDAEKVRDLLPGDAASKDKRSSFSADLWGVAEDKKYLDLAVEFKQPVEVSSLSLAGVNLNNEYGLKDAAIEAVKPDGATTPLPVVTMTEGNTWTALAGLRESISASGLRLRVRTAYKINLTTLTVQGNPAGQKQTLQADLSYRWQDAFGAPLTEPAPLTPFEENTVVSPLLQLGYYGLAVTTRIKDVPDARREFGFVALPAPVPGALPSADPRLGMVHANLRDANLGIGWVKTLTTPFYDAKTETLDADAWQRVLRERRTRGLNELPLVSGDEWPSDSTKPVSAEQLQKLQTKMLQYFKADPDVHHWELGLEENLAWRSHRDTWTHYWPNLEAKARAVRQAATESGADIKLIYQVAELDLRSLEDFLKSDAAKQFDVLALHPYAWPDFPAPEQWVPEFIGKARALMTRHRAVKPIWFTEIGAPHDGNPGGFFGYPSNGAYVRGLSRDEHAAYLVKCHLVALQQGVEKLFWYNYRDGGSDPEYAEHHFGMVDFWGHPKPSYAAYCTMARMLRAKALATTTTLDDNVMVYRFTGDQRDCLVVWTYPAVPKTVRLQTLQLEPDNVVEVLDVVGKAVPVEDDTLALSGSPLYIVVKRPP